MLRVSVLSIILLNLSLFISESMALNDIKSSFPCVGNNFTKVVWAHAVNNANLLSRTLLDNDIMMIEADIQLGTLITNSDKIVPIMAHPPNNISDLSLEIFLQKIDEHNKQISANISPKGVKLDFKHIHALVQSTDLIRSYSKKSSYPFWINADILPGNRSDISVIPVNASDFLTIAKEFEFAWLSIGWTTAGMSGQYSDENIDDMIEALKHHNLKNRITFPIRAVLAAESIEQMENLLKEIENSTLTIWSSEEDNVNVQNLQMLIEKIGIHKLFIDVPNHLKSKLRLNDLATPSRSVMRTFSA